VLATAVTSAPFFDGEVKASLSVPVFYDNFDIKQSRITNDEINEQLLTAVSSLFASTTSTIRQAI